MSAPESTTPAEGALLLVRLREAGAAELVALLRAEGDRLDVAGARQALANPYATAEVVELILARKALLASYELRRDLAACPRTPPPAALRLVPGLYWSDLARMGAEVRLSPVVRRAADRQVLARLPGLALGEKLALARRAGGEVLAALRRDPQPRVVAALLDNPRLTEGLLLPLLAREDAAPAVLRVVADHPRWGVRYPVRLGLARNPRTPLEIGLRLLPLLKKVDLLAVAADPRLAAPLRRRAKTLAGAV
jgi:hypothetical protein